MADWWERLRVPVAVLAIVVFAMAAAALWQPSRSATVAAATPTVALPRPVKVHVAGAVQRPDVYDLTTDHRVADAIRAAGGVTPDADPQRLNLAARLQDGEKIVVPQRVEAEPITAAVPSASPAPVAGLIDLNRAGQAELESLPGIGPVTAEKIIQHRSAHGPFARADDLVEKKLVGRATFEKIRELVVVR